MHISDRAQTIDGHSTQTDDWIDLISSDLFLNKPEEAVVHKNFPISPWSTKIETAHGIFIQKFSCIQSIEHEDYFHLKGLRQFSLLITAILESDHALLSFSESDKYVYSTETIRITQKFINQAKTYIKNYAQKFSIFIKNDTAFLNHTVDMLNTLGELNEMQYLCDKIATCLIILHSKINKIFSVSTYVDIKTHLRPSTPYRVFLRLKRYKNISLWIPDHPEIMRDYCNYIENFKSNIYCIWLNGCTINTDLINKTFKHDDLVQIFKNSDKSILYPKLLRAIEQFKKGIHAEINKLYEHVLLYSSEPEKHKSLHDEYHDFASDAVKHSTAPLKLPQLRAILERFQHDINQHKPTNDYPDSIERLIMPLCDYFRSNIPYSLSLFELFHRTTVLHSQKELSVANYPGIVDHYNALMHFLMQFENIS